MEPLFWPDGSVPAAGCFMAFKAWEIPAAAMEADGDPVDGRVVMAAAGFFVDFKADDGRACAHG